PNPSLASTAPVQQVFDVDTGLGTAGFFAGEVDDPFFFDIPAFSAFVTSVRNGAPNAGVFSRARDTFAGYNILSIALRLPVSLLKGPNGKMVGLDFLTLRHNVEMRLPRGGVRGIGAFRTADRIGNPAVNVVLIPFNRKNEYNTGTPRQDAPARFAGDIVEP